MRLRTRRRHLVTTAAVMLSGVSASFALPAGAQADTGGADYVAIGDSTTTGNSIATCRSDRVTSIDGCSGPAPAKAYPDRIAEDPRFSNVKRIGIWGYTAGEAVIAANNGKNAEGPWTPQLLEAEKAKKLVTVSLGANDMRFGDVKRWMAECLGRQLTTARRATCSDAAKKRAEGIRPTVRGMMNRLDTAKANGAQVVITLYYNPYNATKQVGPWSAAPRDCTPFWAMSEIISGQLNRVLSEEATKHGFTLADLRPRFAGHGAGAKDSYVFGTECDVVKAAPAASFNLRWPPQKSPVNISQAEMAFRFDPHPNAKGTQAQADQILTVVK
ncbi:MAG: hypothetical protein QG671_3422 [Actinomycetota bacterium]|nr:hypothetical protein [Actinomycetota bacterium]